MAYETAFEFDATADYVELRFLDGTCLHVDRRGTEVGVVKTVVEQFALDVLAYNDPFAYVWLMLYGDPSAWLEKNRK